MGKINKKILAEKTHQNLSGRLPADILKRRVRSGKESGPSRKKRKPEGVHGEHKELKAVPEAPGIPVSKNPVMSNTKLFPPPPALMRKQNTIDKEESEHIPVADAVTIKEFPSTSSAGQPASSGNDAATVLDGKVPVPPSADLPQSSSGKVSGATYDSESVSEVEHDFIEPIEVIRLTDDFIEQVDNLLEVSNYFTDPDWMPGDIMDIIHAFVRSLNMDVVTMFLPSGTDGDSDYIMHRGYKIPPPDEVIDSWKALFDNDKGINWNKLLEMAQSVDTDLAYWIVHSDLHSIGYVPIKTGGMIYGFMFVASIGKKKPSPLTASLLDLCGSRIALEYKMKFILSH